MIFSPSWLLPSPPVTAAHEISREYHGQVPRVRLRSDTASRKPKAIVKDRVKTKQYALLIGPRLVTRGDSIFPHGTLAVRMVHLDGEKISTPMDASFNGLVFACQWDENNPDQPSYSWKTFYREVWKIERADAEKMVKMLRKVNRISSSQSVRSFGEYVAFVAKALKIKLALRELDHSTPLSSYNFHEYVRVETSQVAKVIDQIVAEVRSTAVKSAKA
jgi:hypothetical protein